jgi:outer membrane protein assembly factor BamB
MSFVEFQTHVSAAKLRVRRAGFATRFGLLLVMLGTAANVARGADSWLQFRGPGGRSAASAEPPVEFAVESGKNIAWKVETAGRGVGGALVVGDLVFTTSSGGEDERDLYVEAYSSQDGRRVWMRTARALGRPYAHPTSANAAPTPASDGQRIFAFYSSNDLLCYDLEGRLQWVRALAVDHPKAGNDVGMASSPAVIDRVVVVQVENQGDSFAAGLDAETGETLWERERPRRANWASPLALRLEDGRAAVVLQNGDNVQVLGARSGDLLFQFDVPASTIASAVAVDQRLLVPARGLTVIDTALPSPEIAFESSRLRTRNASHIVFGDRVYTCNGSVLVAGNLEDGDILWQQRLPNIRSVWATPVATASGIYVFGQNGEVVVVRDNMDDENPDCEVLHETNLEGNVLASPAVSGDALFVRTETALLKIAAN